MPHGPELSFDVATGLAIGRRERQEDALVADFPVGEPSGLVVLADGMGGHAAGGLASRIAVSEVFAELLFRRAEADVFEANVPHALLAAARMANHAILAEADRDPDLTGMGATLVAPVFGADGLNWLSIGDSPLWLFRGATLTQLNEDHSLAPQIDMLVEQGHLSPEDGAAHPDRNCLTSALGAADIPLVDCPDAPVPLEDGDIVLAASDGLQVLSDAEIESLLNRFADLPAQEIARRLMEAVESVGDPEQDNLSLAVVRVRIGYPVAAIPFRSRRSAEHTRPLTAKMEATMRGLASQARSSPP